MTVSYTTSRDAIRGPADMQQIATYAATLRTTPPLPLVDAYRAFRQAELDAG